MYLYATTLKFLLFYGLGALDFLALSLRPCQIIRTVWFFGSMILKVYVNQRLLPSERTQGFRPENSLSRCGNSRIKFFVASCTNSPLKRDLIQCPKKRKQTKLHLPSILRPLRT